ncbi:MAG: 3-keto-disaccharide hydrolase [Planctomycetota bacterium]
MIHPLFLALHGLGLAAAPTPTPSVPAPEVTMPVAGEWVELFDGATLSGWTQRNGTATYEVVDGAIIGTTSAGSPNSFLCSDRFYGDYELEFDVKLFDDQLNSGVQIRSHSNPGFKEGRVHGYQVEVATNGHAGFIYDEAGRGWLSKDRDQPASRAAFKSGEWNRYKVICFGQSIRTWVNGVPVASVTDAVSPAGFIGLQVHSVGGDPKWRVGWKNLRLRQLGDGGGFASLFNGRNLKGWKVAERPESVRVENGALIVNGDRAHVFYDGPVYHHSFKNFELRALVRSKPGSNSGIYFHTAFQEAGWPSKGYEVQVNNTQGDWRRTGGLYGIDDLKEPPAKDDEWFPMHIRVVGKRVQITVNGNQVIDYTEPDDVERPESFAGRLVDRGTFALQAHDPASEVWYKAIEVRPLPE